MFIALFLVSIVLNAEVKSEIQYSDSGLVINWAPSDGGYDIYFHKQARGKTIDSFSYELVTTTSQLPVNCKFYREEYNIVPETHTENVYYEAFWKLDLHTFGDGVNFESLLTKTCEQYDVHMSIGHDKEKYKKGTKSLPNNVYMVFMDPTGACYKRSYGIRTDLEYTATVTRSAVVKTECPEDMLEELKNRPKKTPHPMLLEYKGIVKEWTPEGKAFLMDYTKNSRKDHIIFTLSYPDIDGKRFKFVCKESEVPGGPLFTGTIIVEGESVITLDRVKLQKCNEENIRKTFFVGFDTGYYIEFMTTKQKYGSTTRTTCYRRNYGTEMGLRQMNYQYVKVTRNVPIEIECPKPPPKNKSGPMDKLRSCLPGCSRTNE